MWAASTRFVDHETCFTALLILFKSFQREGKIFSKTRTNQSSIFFIHIGEMYIKHIFVKNIAMVYATNKQVFKKLVLICFLAVLSGVITACSKKSGDFCWSCEVTGQGYYRKVDTCTKENKIPQFVDANGNQLNEFCQRR